MVGPYLWTKLHPHPGDRRCNLREDLPAHAHTHVHTHVHAHARAHAHAHTHVHAIGYTIMISPSACLSIAVG